MEKIIDIKNLRVSFHTYAGEVQAVRDVSFYAKRERHLQLWENRAVESRLHQKL